MALSHVPHSCHEGRASPHRPLLSNSEATWHARERPRGVRERYSKCFSAGRAKVGLFFLPGARSVAAQAHLGSSQQNLFSSMSAVLAVHSKEEPSAQARGDGTMQTFNVQARELKA